MPSYKLARFEPISNIQYQTYCLLSYPLIHTFYGRRQSLLRN